MRLLLYHVMKFSASVVVCCVARLSSYMAANSTSRVKSAVCGHLDWQLQASNSYLNQYSQSDHLLSLMFGCECSLLHCHLILVFEF